MSADPAIGWRQVPGRGRWYWVADRLWRLAPESAPASVVLPLELNWSAPGRLYELRDRRRRARLYEVVLREGSPREIQRYVDGLLLADIWPDLVVPRDLRAARQPVIETVDGSRAEPGTSSIGAVT